MSEPAVSVVVPSHGRALRLRWLLNALEEQTVGGFEVVVVHDYPEPVRRRLLDGHPLVSRGVARLLAIQPGTGTPGRQRNAGWRAARAPLVAFVDDDCRPEPDWLERLLAVAARHPGAVVQGATRPDPYEGAVFAAPHGRSLTVTPPTLQGHTCNVLYPHAALEALGGFEEPFTVGEDVDLAVRARRRGTAWVPAPEALVNHCVEAVTTAGLIRVNWKWRDLPRNAGRHPEVRRAYAYGLFLDPARARVALAVAGLAGAVRAPALALLALPYAARALRARGTRPVERCVAAVELPGRFAVDAAELLTLAAGSVKHRTLLL